MPARALRLRLRLLASRFLRSRFESPNARQGIKTHLGLLINVSLNNLFESPNARQGIKTIK